MAVESKQAQFVVGAVIFMLLVGVVVLLRRSEFGSQLFAFKDSPAACATLGMNTRVLPIAVFAISAAIAGLGGAIYGQALGSAAPDIFQFFGGLSVLLTMVIFGIGSVGAGVGTGLFLGGPTLTNFFPGLLQLQSVLIGGTAIGVGTSPNGMLPSAFRPIWGSVARRRVLLVAIIAAVIGLWALAYGGVIDNWTMVWCLLVVVVVVPGLPYVVDYQRRTVAPVFGLPDRRSGSAPPSVSGIRLPASVGLSSPSGAAAASSVGSES